jgi:hypothetical protein
VRNLEFLPFFFTKLDQGYPAEENEIGRNVRVTLMREIRKAYIYLVRKLG